MNGFVSFFSLSLFLSFVFLCRAYYFLEVVHFYMGFIR